MRRPHFRLELNHVPDHQRRNGPAHGEFDSALDRLRCIRREEALHGHDRRRATRPVPDRLCDFADKDRPVRPQGLGQHESLRLKSNQAGRDHAEEKHPVNQARKGGSATACPGENGEISQEESCEAESRDGKVGDGRSSRAPQQETRGKDGQRPDGQGQTSPTSARRTSARCWAISRTVLESSASTITRTSISVPEYRTKIRPIPFNAAS